MPYTDKEKRRLYNKTYYESNRDLKIVRPNLYLLKWFSKLQFVLKDLKPKRDLKPIKPKQIIIIGTKKIKKINRLNKQPN
jgi:hypothetical protein